MKALFHIVFFWMTSTYLLAQDIIYAKELPKKDKKQFDKALKYQKEGKNDKAIKAFDKLLSKNPGLVEALARKGAISYQQKKYAAAIALFQKAIQSSPKKDKRLYYSLATAAKENQSFDISIDAYNKYLDLCGDHKKSCNKARKLRDQLVFTKEAMANPVPFNPIKLSEAINTFDSEYLPAFTADGSRMIFTRRIANQEDFYESVVDDSTFLEARFLETLNTGYNEGAHAISTDGHYLVYTVCNQRKTIGSCDLYQSRKEKDGWTTPASMGDFINSISWDAQPSLSADGQTLYFASKRRGGFGGSDLWMTTKNSRGQWNAPENLGEEINKSGNQESPYIHPDGRTLYFRSDSHPGMGDFDLFVSKKDSEGNWSKPLNLGYPINTPESQGGLHVSLDGTKAYFASDHHFKPNDPRRNLDIFSFDMHDAIRPHPSTYLKIMVFDEMSKNSIDADILIKELKTDNTIVDRSMKANEPLLTTLTIGNNYYIDISADGYIYKSENVNLDSTRIALDPYILQIYLSRLPVSNTPVASTPEPSKPIILKNIFFESGQAILKEISNEEITRLSNQLAKQTHLSIKITGHTDNVGRESDNMKLSLERAKAIYDALVIKGIDKRRMSYEGRGELDPIDTNDTEAGRRNNRRTEFVLN